MSTCRGAPAPHSCEHGDRCDWRPYDAVIDLRKGDPRLVRAEDLRARIDGGAPPPERLPRLTDRQIKAVARADAQHLPRTGGDHPKMVRRSSAKRRR